MSEWKRVPLGELYSFRSGLSKSRSAFGSGYGFLAFKNVFHNYFVPERLTELVNSTEQERESCSVHQGDVFLTRTSETMDELAMSCVALKNYPDATFNGFTKRLRPNEDSGIVPEYAGYYFRSPRFRREVTAMASLSTRASLNNEMLERLTMLLPSVDEQVRIGSVLKSLDDKIELNRQMNRTLEAIARAIFKSWFIDFDPVHAKAEGREPVGMDPETAALFPDNFQDSPLGRIPQGWNVEPLSELCTLGRGASPRPINDYMNGEVPWVKISDATASGGPFLFETKERLKVAGVDRSVSVAPGDLILSNSATCGIPMFVELSGCIHDGWLYFKNLQEISKLYLFHALIELAEHLIHIAYGSVQKNLNTSLVGRQDILVPPTTIAAAFDGQASHLFGKIRLASLESRTLAALRDILLPKLLSGELAVSDSSEE